MPLKYYYSPLGNFLFLIFGLALLGVGLDLLVLHRFIQVNIAPPNFVLFIMIGLGFLTFSGSLLNLLKGKDVVLSADTSGLTIFTKSTDKALAEIFVTWPDIHELSTEVIQSTFRDTQGGHRSVLSIRLTPNLVQWPPLMFTKNKIKFKQTPDYDEITIDAWLNKSKKQIVSELNNLKPTP